VTDHVSPDAPGALKFSASAAETHQLCHRKGFLSRRTPKLHNDSFSFGTATHSVCERYLSADDNGRVPEPPSAAIDMNLCWDEGPLAGQKWGDAVNLYPDGWAGDIDLGMQSLIKQLVQMGIEQGVLERRPGRIIEGEFIHFLRKAHPLDETGAVRLRGFIDLQMPGEIQDHKTAKIAKYAKGPEQLYKDLQMLLYAWWYFYQHPDDVEVIIRHNSFIKGWDYKKRVFNPKVRNRETTVTREYVLKWWDATIEPIIDEMLVIEPLALEQWEEVQPAQRGSGACEKYGGCQFAGLCSGLDTLDEYLERIEATMGIFDDIAAEAALAEPTVGATLALDPPPIVVTPPWAWDKCPACEGEGFNKKGNPCRICDSNGSIRSEQFDISQDDQGKYSWGAKPVVAPVAAPVEVTVRKAESDLLSEEIQDEIPTEGTKRGKGRPKKGFTLVINANASRVQGTVVQADQLWHEITSGLAKASGVGSYFELHPFERRDAIAVQSEKICSHFTGTTWVLANGNGPDFEHFVNNVLRPHAANVIEQS
jgi:hypothetical protein